MEIFVFISCFIIIALASGQIGQGLRKTGLPLITGFLLTGIIAGPYGLDLISRDAVRNLKFVDEFSLGFIALAAGGELYLKELRLRLKTIAWVTAGHVVFTFLLAVAAVFFLWRLIPFMSSMPVQARVAVAILAGAILVARSPSSAIAVVNELRAKGPFTQTILGVTVIMDVVVIMLFSAGTSIADALFTGLEPSFGFLLLLLCEISLAVAAGWLLSRLILGCLALPIPGAGKSGLVLLAGYLAFALSSQIREFSPDVLQMEILIEPLLICMTAGFFVSNTSSGRKEFLKILHDISIPVYIAFFTLTGASLALDLLVSTWPIAVALFLSRTAAVFIGSFFGGLLAGNPLKDNCVSWMGYITQAGVGLGLAKEVAVEFPEWGNPFATMIISIIVMNQLIGPPLLKLAIKIMKEDHPKASGDEGFEGIRDTVIFGSDGQSSALALSLASQDFSVKLATARAEARAEETEGVEILPIPELTASGLKQVGCHHTGAIVAMLSDDDNFKICETAYEHFGTPTLVARLNDRNNFGCFHALGVLIVDPSTAIVSLLDHFVRSPAAASLLMGMHQGRDVLDLRVNNPNLSGLALRDLRLPFDTIIMSVKRRGMLFIPHNFTRLEAGDIVTVVGSLKSLKELALRFDADQEEAMLQLVEKATAKELSEKPLQPEVKDIISRETHKAVHKKDRFDYIVENCRILDIKQAMDKEEFFQLVSGELSESLRIPASELYDLLAKREQEVSTVLAPGLAVPHIIVDGENRFSLLAVRCRKGIEFSRSAPPVYAAFVLAGTRDERTFHLQALSAIAQIVLDPRFEQKWTRAKNRKALRQVLLDAERKREV
ncbi:MAG: PTS sugar transporter subunit IIA [Desulfobacteraceae bacterium]